MDLGETIELGGTQPVGYMDLGFQIQYKHLVLRFPSDLMKSTVVDESLSYYKTNVLFKRILQDFKINSTV